MSKHVVHRQFTPYLTGSLKTYISTKTNAHKIKKVWSNSQGVWVELNEGWRYPTGASVIRANNSRKAIEYMKTIIATKEQESCKSSGTKRI